MEKEQIRLTIQEESFINDVVYGDFEPIDAYRRVYSTKGLTNAVVKFRANALMKKPNVQQKYQQLIEQRKFSNNVDKAYVTKHLKELVEDKKNVSASVRVRALEALGKSCNMFNEAPVLDDSEHTKNAETIKQKRQQLRNIETKLGLVTKEDAEKEPAWGINVQ